VALCHAPASRDAPPPAGTSRHASGARKSVAERPRHWRGRRPDLGDCTGRHDPLC
jgi:hypothetical protein